MNLARPHINAGVCGVEKGLPRMRCVSSSPPMSSTTKSTERTPHRVLPRRPWQPSGKRMAWSASCRRIRVADNGPHSNLSYVTLDMMFTPEPRSQKASEKTWGSDGALDRWAARITLLGHECQVEEWTVARAKLRLTKPCCDQINSFDQILGFSRDLTLLEGWDNGL